MATAMTMGHWAMAWHGPGPWPVAMALAMARARDFRNMDMARGLHPQALDVLKCAPLLAGGLRPPHLPNKSASGLP